MSEEKDKKSLSDKSDKRYSITERVDRQGTKIHDSDGSDDVIKFDSGGRMPPGKVVTESTKGDVRKHVKK
ncbi:TPA: hypothetical protein ACSTJX_003878 [Serratia fonticola]